MDIKYYLLHTYRYMNNQFINTNNTLFVIVNFIVNMCNRFLGINLETVTDSVGSTFNSTINYHRNTPVS